VASDREAWSDTGRGRVDSTVYHSGWLSGPKGHIVPRANPRISITSLTDQTRKSIQQRILRKVFTRRLLLLSTPVDTQGSLRNHLALADVAAYLIPFARISHESQVRGFDFLRIPIDSVLGSHSSASAHTQFTKDTYGKRCLVTSSIPSRMPTLYKWCDGRHNSYWSKCFFFVEATCLRRLGNR
jgi:hypothetical protein